MRWDVAVRGAETEDVGADAMEISPSGVLIFYIAGAVAIAYSPQTWLTVVETEK